MSTQSSLHGGWRWMSRSTRLSQFVGAGFNPALLLLTLPWLVAGAGIVFQGTRGPGKGKHIVLVSGDDEYRSEEALPQLAKILAKQHGFKCTVLFPIDKETGEIKPDYQENIPGLELLRSADLMVMFLRFRNLPDDQMAYIFEYV